MNLGGDFTKKNGTGGESIYNQGSPFEDEDLTMPIDAAGYDSQTSGEYTYALAHYLLSSLQYAGDGEQGSRYERVRQTYRSLMSSMN